MYNYEEQKSEIMTDEGQRTFLKIRDKANKLLEEAGAFTMMAPSRRVTGDSWFHMACIDRMVELGEIAEVTASGVAGQHRVFVAALRGA